MTTDIDKPIEQRVHDLESFVWDFPNLINLRFVKTETALREFGERLAAMERQMGAMQTDLRDMRGGVTRLLVAQDQTIRELGQRMDRLEMAQTALRSEMASMVSEMASMRSELDARLSGFNDRLDRLDSKLDLIIARLPKA